MKSFHTLLLMCFVSLLNYNNCSIINSVREERAFFPFNSESDFCKPPELSEIIDTDLDAFVAPSSGGGFLPVGSTVDNEISQSLLNSTCTGCMRMTVSNPEFTVLTFASAPGTPSVHFHCEKPIRGKGLYVCEHLRKGSEPDLSHVAWRTLSDGKTFAFVRRCFPFLKKEAWVVFSMTQPSLGNQLTCKIKEHVKSLGLNPSDISFRDYSGCKPVCLI